MIGLPIFIHHHLGLGDHIICNGLVRSLLNNGKVFGQIFLFAKERNAQRVSRMFVDEPRIQIVSIPSDVNEIQFVNSVIHQYGIVDFVRCGFSMGENLKKMGVVSNFDQGFYACAGVPYEKRWSAFKISRDSDNEARVYAKLNPDDSPYMFVHDDPSRGFVLDVPNPSGLKVIKNDPSVDMFDMMGILEGASEIHCMESSFSNLIEYMPNVVCPLYLHKSMRKDTSGNSENAESRMKNWIIV